MKMKTILTFYVKEFHVQHNYKPGKHDPWKDGPVIDGTPVPR